MYVPHTQTHTVTQASLLEGDMFWGENQSCSINLKQPVVIDQLVLLKAGAQANQYH